MDNQNQPTPAKKRTRATKLQAAEKRLSAFRYLRAGATWEEIAHHSGYNSAQAACKAVSSYLKKQSSIEANDYRMLQKMRYERKLVSLDEQTSKGDIQAINAWVKIMARLDTLMGVEAPKQLDVTSGGQSLVIEVVRRDRDELKANDEYTNSPPQITS
jgi:hypothetical protein